MNVSSLILARTLAERFRSAFLIDDRWLLYFKGLKNTLLMSLFAVLIGIVFGVILAIILYTKKKTGKLKILSAIANIYVTVIRGTPVVLQLFIMYFIVLMSVKNGIVMTGGGSLLYGLDYLITNVTGIQTRVADKAVSCVALGTGKSLDNISMIPEGAINISRTRTEQQG